MTRLSRRRLLQAAFAGTTGLALSSLDLQRALAGSALTTPCPTPTPSTGYPSPCDSNVPLGTRLGLPLPRPKDAMGVADESLPFDHVIVVMQENHSFDNYFGMLAKANPLIDGFTFAPGTSTPTNENPGPGGQYLRSFRLEGTCQPGGVSQAWKPTHDQTNGGRMNGFVLNSAGGGAGTPAAMGYWTAEDIPFYYDLANHFTVGNRSFCATQGQTYPNRRFLYSGTAAGMVSTSMDTFMTSAVPYPSGGTLFDAMSAATVPVTWKSYFTDLPTVAIIPETIEKYGSNFAPMSQLLVDLQSPVGPASTLPSVCFVDTEMGVADEVGGTLSTYLNTAGNLTGLSAQSTAAINDTRAENGDEENPADISIGENQVSTIIKAIMASSYWQRTLIVLTYDEHGGYYDHVAPVRMAVPDSVGPNAEAGGTTYDGYATSGVRIPTVVVSPYSRAGGVSNVAHDHTAIIKTIATKWNLPALTYRDLAAPTLFSYVDFSRPPQYATAPSLAAPSTPAAVSMTCRSTPQAYAFGPDDGFFAAGPAATLPEAPLPVLLPAAGLVGALATVVTRHNREARRVAALGAAERAGTAPPPEALA